MNRRPETSNPTLRAALLLAGTVLLTAAMVTVGPAAPAGARCNAQVTGGAGFDASGHCPDQPGGGRPARPTPPGRPVFFEYGLEFEAGDGVAFTIPLSVFGFGLPNINIPNGCFSLTTISGPLDTAPIQNSYSEVSQQLAGYEGGLWPPCPGDPFDLAAHVANFWQTSVAPPPPTPLAVQPGLALTGLPAYLEIGGEIPVTWELSNPIGPPVVITAVPRYVIDWGDGSSVVETTGQGRPYPGGDGEITHVYTEDTDVTITVDAYWTGEWSVGSGEITELPELTAPTTATLELPVEQRQAVTD